MDFKQELIEELKKKGLDVAEEALAGLAEALFDVAQKYVIASENKYDDLLVAVLPSAKKLVMEQIDKIDGQEG